MFREGGAPAGDHVQVAADLPDPLYRVDGLLDEDLQEVCRGDEGDEVGCGSDVSVKECEELGLGDSVAEGEALEGQLVRGLTGDQRNGWRGGRCSFGRGSALRRGFGRERRGRGRSRR
eukprot:8419059-Heterocapsa_arctica.AAC.1